MDRKRTKKAFNEDWQSPVDEEAEIAKLLSANPRLARLITDAIGDQWITDLDRSSDRASIA